MLSRVWPRAPWSGADETSNIIDINDSISGARGVDNNDTNDDDNGGGTAIPERRRLRQGQLRRFGGDGGNDGDCGKGDCDGHGDDKGGDMVMRQQHIAMAMTMTTTMTTATRDVHQLHKVKSTSYAYYSLSHLVPQKQRDGTLIHGIST